MDLIWNFKHENKKEEMMRRKKQTFARKHDFIGTNYGEGYGHEGEKAWQLVHRNAHDVVDDFGVRTAAG
ncbi:hypothetical protein J27TS7_11980 [Paenibacillus dendritiformis]|nr:hypothetical protein J27TS7_11980 [Paenibacillus dendritiformis]